jgi:hypothetical protein
MTATYVTVILVSQAGIITVFGCLGIAANCITGMLLSDRQKSPSEEQHDEPKSKYELTCGLLVKP